MALTASAFETDRVKVIENGGNDFVRKPFREKELFEIMEKHLNIRFIRENLTSMARTEQSGLDENVIGKAFSLLPKVLQIDFVQAVKEIDFNAAMAMISRIEKENDLLAGMLTDMINAYQFDALEEIIANCKSPAVCVGDDGIGPWQDPEMKALLRRFVNEKKTGNIVPIIPVLLPGAPGDVKLPPFLEEFTWVDLRDGFVRKVLKIHCLITFPVIAGFIVQELYRGVSMPYPALEYADFWGGS